MKSLKPYSTPELFNKSSLTRGNECLVPEWALSASEYNFLLFVVSLSSFRRRNWIDLMLVRAGQAFRGLQ